jgi:hypothetical protein
MPTLPTIIEREFLDLSRAALQLERLTVGADPIPSPVRYQQILKRLSELQSRWLKHRNNQRARISKFLSNDVEVSRIVQDWDAPSFNVELQLKAVSISNWPRFPQAGLSSLRVAVPDILQLVYQQIARERAACATWIHRRTTSPAKRPMLVRAESARTVKQISA